MVNNKKDKKKGFTLIELIVVMAIILVLGSLLLPRYNGYKSKAEKLKIVDTGRQIYLAAIESYVEGNNDFDEETIKQTTKELVGVEDIEVTCLGGEISIQYSVDSKKYTLAFSDSGNGFHIKDTLGELLYPKNSGGKIAVD